MLHEQVRVLHMIASLNPGGSQSMVMSLYRAIDRNRVQFDFVIDHPGELALQQEIEALGGRVYEFAEFTGRNIRIVTNAWDMFFSSHPEYRILHTHSRSYASLYLPIAKKHGLTTIAHSHSTSNGSGPKALIKTALQLPIRYQADYLFACSQEAGEWLYGKRATRGKNFRIIPNAIDSEKFSFDPQKRDEVRRELNLQDSFVVGHVGRLTEPKNHKFLFRVFREKLKTQPNSVLLLVGDGDLYDALKAETKALGIADKVLFLGARSNVSDYYQAMDAFVFPSLWEGLGMAVIEAQAAGLSCVAADTVPKTVDIRAGLVKFLSLDESVSAWADKVKEVPRTDTSQFVCQAGFDIAENATKLQRFYEGIGS